MSDITLHYFDLHARAETLRMIFVFAGVEFNDHRVPFEDWANLKGNNFAEFGQLPVLEIDGEKLVQSQSMVRYVCQKYGYYPSDLKEVYQVESICDLKEDLFRGLIPLIFKKETENLEKYYSESAPHILAYLNKRLEKNNDGNGFFVGDGVSMADFQAFEIVYDYFLAPNRKEKYEQHRLYEVKQQNCQTSI